MVARGQRLARAHWPLLVLLLVGAAVRIAMMASAAPALLSYPDTWGYVKGAAEELFVPETRRTAGYSLVLRILHDIDASITFAIIVQHLMGLASAVVVYAIALRAGAGRWLALIGAGVAALSFDNLYVEHSLLSESVWALLMLSAILAAQIALGDGAQATLTRRSAIAYGIAGLLLGTAVTIRPTAIATIAAAAVIVLLFSRGPVLTRAARVTSLAVPAAAVLLAYVLVQQSVTGFSGLAPARGWALYGRAAPFADCRYFTPPKGTEFLCEATAPRDRPGGDFYGWDPQSPAHVSRSGMTWEEIDPILQKWSSAAIRQEPKAFIRAAASDLWRFVDPSDEPKPRSGGTNAEVRLDNYDAGIVRLNRSVADRYYGPVRAHRAQGLHTLADVQEVVRFHGPLMLAALMLFLAGLAFARGVMLRTMLLLASVGFLIPIFSAVYAMFGWRYAVPVQSEMAAAGALGAIALVARARLQRSPRLPRLTAALRRDGTARLD